MKREIPCWDSAMSLKQNLCEAFSETCEIPCSECLFQQDEDIDLTLVVTYKAPIIEEIK